MKTLLFTLSLWVTTIAVHANSGQDYLERFTQYTQWSQHLPQLPSESFLNFIGSDTPLAKKLREKWLYHLIRQKDWASFNKYYKTSADINLQCFSQLSKYYTGHEQEALLAARMLWLSGDSQPPACNTLFGLLIQTDSFDERWINQRIILALEKSNLSLVRYLLKLYRHPRPQDEKLLDDIAQNPSRINQIGAGELHDFFYLYGLKRLISINMDQAIAYWQSAQTQQRLNEAQQQTFLVHLALYKAMRNHEDASFWFTKIKPIFYNDALLDWQIRLALKRQQWSQVEHLTTHSQAKDKPCWQYWLARALEIKGEQTKATAMYQSIAKNRHYYGFLASMRLHKAPNFENESPVTNRSRLNVYQSFLDTIQWLYHNKQSLQASRLLNDFVSELPKEDKSALIYWIAHDLQWYDKSVYLSNTEDLKNQLLLRFPLIYRAVIIKHATTYHIAQALIYSIIRQESGFREEVISPAGARGLMQIMPSTAAVVAKRERIPYGDKNQLFSSEKNIHIGVAYLKQLTHHYNHPVLIAAAYNAGPSQVNYWLKNHPPKEVDIWIDTLPWHETRNYLKNIIAFCVVYQYLLAQKPNLEHFMQTL